MQGNQGNGLRLLNDAEGPWTHGKQRAFAEKADLDEAAFSRIRRGLTDPDLESAAKIELATHGKVPASSWAKIRPRASGSTKRKSQRKKRKAAS